MALRVEETEDPDKFRVSGRGELHLSILIENMRREGYELAGIPSGSYPAYRGWRTARDRSRTVTVDVEEAHQGSVMEQLGLRKGEMTQHDPGWQRVASVWTSSSRAVA